MEAKIIPNGCNSCAFFKSLSVFTSKNTYPFEMYYFKIFNVVFHDFYNQLSTLCIQKILTCSTFLSLFHQISQKYVIYYKFSLLHGILRTQLLRCISISRVRNTVCLLLLGLWLQEDILDAHPGCTSWMCIQDVLLES